MVPFEPPIPMGTVMNQFYKNHYEPVLGNLKKPVPMGTGRFERKTRFPFLQCSFVNP